MHTRTAAGLAELFNLSERRIYQLVEEQIIPQGSQGKYELKASLQGYIKYLQSLAMGRSNSNEQKDWKTKLLKAQAEKATLELEALRGKYVEASEVEFELKNLIITFRSRMLAMSGKLVRSLAAAGGDFVAIEKILDDEVRDALTELSKYGEDDYQGNGEGAGATSQIYS